MGLVVLSWGAGPPITKLVTASPLVGVFIRFGISFPLLFAVVYLRGSSLTPDLFKRTALPGIAFGINLIFVFATLQEATVSVLSTMVAVQPALLLVVGGRLFGEYATAKQILWSGGGIVGAIIVIVGAGEEVRASALGLILAFSAMLSFSVYFVLTRMARSTTDVDPIEWMAGINFWAFMAGALPSIFFVSRADWAEFGGLDWLWIAIVAYLTGVLGHVAMSWVHGYIEAARSSLYLLAMHIVAVGLAWPIHDEPFTLVQGLGGLVLLGSVTAVMRLPARAAPSPAPTSA